MAVDDCQILVSLRDEQKTLRDEILGTIKSRYEILGFGLAAIGVSAGAATRSGAGAFSWAAFAVVIPALLAFMFALWSAEYLRMARVSQHLAMLEVTINRCLGTTFTLSWELRRRGYFVRSPDDTGIPLTTPDHYQGLQNRLTQAPKGERRARTVWNRKAKAEQAGWGRSSIDLHLPVTYGALVGIAVSGLSAVFVEQGADGYTNRDHAVMLGVSAVVFGLCLWNVVVFRRRRDEYGFVPLPVPTAACAPQGRCVARSDTVVPSQDEEAGTSDQTDVRGDGEPVLSA